MSVETNSHNYTNMNLIFSQFVAAENSVRLSEGMAEGGCGGNSAMPERNQKVDSPAVLLEEAGHHRKILFSLEEKEIRRAQNEKSKEYFSVVVRAERATAGLAIQSSDVFRAKSQRKLLMHTSDYFNDGSNRPNNRVGAFLL